MEDVGEGDFDVARFVVRVRRLADLSQRDLAARLGMSPSSVADIESGRRQVSARQLMAILRLAGLRLCVVDADGVEVQPVSPRVVRDNAGRRFPAHLDVTHPDELPPERIRSPRYDRAPATAWYHLRETRDRLRAEAGVNPSMDEPMDHLTPDAIRWRRRARLEARRLAARERAVARGVAAGVDAFDCSCETQCWCGTTCVRECGCQCEPA